jgi:hypothetical protein
MDLVFDILKITIPAVIVALTAYFLIKQTISSTSETKSIEVKGNTQKEIVLLRLQAYERLILLMERITPDNLVMRIDGSGNNVNEFHLELLSIIRAEFDHNISQQLYVSDVVWHEITNAKEEVIKLINVTFHQIEDASILAMSRKIVEAHLRSKMPTQKAINTIKSEVRQLF